MVECEKVASSLNPNFGFKKPKITRCGDAFKASRQAGGRLAVLSKDVGGLNGNESKDQRPINKYFFVSKVLDILF